MSAILQKLQAKNKMDFTQIISNFNGYVFSVVAAVTAVAVLKFAPSFVRWSYLMVMYWFFRFQDFFTPHVNSSTTKTAKRNAKKLRKKYGFNFSSANWPNTASNPSVESNLPAEDRFRVFGAIFGFISAAWNGGFGDWVIKLLLFFKR